MSTSRSFRLTVTCSVLGALIQTVACVSPQASEPEMPVIWSSPVSYQIDNAGKTPPIHVQFDGDLRYLAVLAHVGDQAVPENFCLRMEPARLESGITIVGETSAQADGSSVCTTCSQRVFDGNGRALFLFPNDGSELQGPDVLTFQIQVRDCIIGIPATGGMLSGMPREIQIQTAWELAAPYSPSELGIGFAVLPEARIDQDTLDSAWKAIHNIFRSTGIEPYLVDIIDLPPDSTSSLTTEPDKGVDFVGGSQTLLDDLALTAVATIQQSGKGAPFTAVILAPCLREFDPVSQSTRYLAGISPRIPGSGPWAERPSAVFVATGECRNEFGSTELPDFKDGAELGLLISHEIGHYLGLYHSDMPAGSHLVTSAAGNVMNSNVLAIAPETASFSPAQADVMRRHPDVQQH